MAKNQRQVLREKGIQYRDSLDQNQRRQNSRIISHKILQSEAYKKARNIFLYKAVKGEVRLDYLEEEAQKDGKNLVYPFCLSKTEMVALQPQGQEAWKRSSFGLLEPSIDKSTLVEAHDLDLIICPCVAFDQKGNRIGMGGGYYDRYLKNLRSTSIFAVAFEGQKVEKIPVEAWDVPMTKVITEVTIYPESF